MKTKDLVRPCIALFFIHNPLRCGIQDQYVAGFFIQKVPDRAALLFKLNLSPLIFQDISRDHPLFFILHLFCLFKKPEELPSQRGNAYHSDRLIFFVLVYHLCTYTLYRNLFSAVLQRLLYIGMKPDRKYSVKRMRIEDDHRRPSVLLMP